MRDHKACLPDGASRRLFFKWQRGHQMVIHGIISEGRRVRFQVRRLTVTTGVNNNNNKTKKNSETLLTFAKEAKTGLLKQNTS